MFSHLENFLQLIIILSNNDIGLTVFSNKVASFRRICGVDTYSQASEIMTNRIIRRA